jgi:hypothetical protein
MVQTVAKSLEVLCCFDCSYWCGRCTFGLRFAVLKVALSEVCANFSDGKFESEEHT